MRALGNTWAAEEGRRKSTYTEATPALVTTVDEVDGKDRFLRAVKDVLTREQNAALFNPALEGRIGLDLLSPGLVYGMQRPVVEKSRAELENKICAGLLELAEIQGEEAAAFGWVARQWLDETPGCLVPVQGQRDIDLMFPRVAQVQEAARAEAGAIERIVQTGRLTPEQNKTLLAVAMVLVPRIMVSPEGGK